MGVEVWQCHCNRNGIVDHMNGNAYGAGMVMANNDIRTKWFRNVIRTGMIVKSYQLHRNEGIV